MAKRRVAVVEDSAEMRGIVTRALGRAGFAVVEAADGESAMAILENGEPLHLIVLDLVLPDLDGFEVLRRIGKYPAHARVPVIVITGEFDRSESIAGATAIVHKPFEISQLERLALRHALSAS